MKQITELDTKCSDGEMTATELSEYEHQLEVLNKLDAIGTKLLNLANKTLGDENETQ
jgi:hypothetical protein